MFNLVEKRRWFFLLSALFIIPGLIVIGFSWVTTGAPFRLGIDFVGGSIYDIALEGADVLGREHQPGGEPQTAHGGFPAAAA